MKHVVHQIKDRIVFSQIVSKYVKLTKKGDSFLGRCPFHVEQTPSFYVNDMKKLFYCFGCKEGGDVFSFLEKVENKKFIDILRDLAAEYGIEYNKEKFTDDIDKMYKVLEAAANWYSNNLRYGGNDFLYKYLRERKLDAQIIRDFKLGYGSPRGDELKEYLLKSGFDLATQNKAGIVLESGYDLMTRRLVIPICDTQGRVIGFGGRILGDQIRGPKYLNSPETDLFVKGDMLFNYNKAYRERGPIYVVEGYFDVISMHQQGYRRVVAPLGTALTERQLMKLWGLSEEPYVIFDGDKAGLKAAYKAIMVALPFLSAERSLRFVILPPDADPDKIMKVSEGKGAMQEFIDGGKSILDFMWGYVLSEIRPSTPEQWSKVRQGIIDNINKIQDFGLRQIYFKIFYNRINIALNKVIKFGKNDKIAGGLNNLTRRKTSNLILQEKILVVSCLMKTYLIYEVESNLWEIEFIDKRLNQFRDDIFNVLARMGEKNLLNELRNMGYGEIINELVAKEVLIHTKFLESDDSKEVINSWKEIYNFYKNKVKINV